jgi:sensor histidine kinase regulating citrate/malate metabolism
LITDNVPYTGNVAVDGLLYNYLCKAAVSNIDFKYTGKLNINGIADMDLCVILGNALDNAFAGCLTLPDNRKVTLVTQIEKSTLFLNIKNTFDGKIEKKENLILSRKRENSEGIGLKSIKSICDKYRGTLELKWDKDTFVILIILTLNQGN